MCLNLNTAALCPLHEFSHVVVLHTHLVTYCMLSCCILHVVGFYMYMYFVIRRWVATSALPPLDKLYRRRPLFEEAAYWFTAAVCNALLTNIPSACVITEEDRSGKYEHSKDLDSIYTSGTGWPERKLWVDCEGNSCCCASHASGEPPRYWPKFGGSRQVTTLDGRWDYGYADGGDGSAPGLDAMDPSFIPTRELTPKSN